MNELADKITPISGFPLKMCACAKNDCLAIINCNGSLVLTVSTHNKLSPEQRNMLRQYIVIAANAYPMIVELIEALEQLIRYDVENTDFANIYGLISRAKALEAAK